MLKAISLRIINFFVILVLLLSIAYPVMASPYTDYCETTVDYIITVLGLSEEYLMNNPVTFSINIMPDGTVKDVDIRGVNRSRIVKWENKVLDIKFPAHQIMRGIGGGPDVYVSQRLIRKSTLAKLEEQEFLYNLRSSVAYGFGYYDRDKKYSAKVSYTVDKMGRLRRYEIVESSGNSAFDNAVLKHLDKRQEHVIMYLPESKGNMVTDTITFTNK